jgi:Copper transport outer membrane protein, MctB
MINIRYHVYSLVAVFLALAIGVAAGSTVVQRSVVDNLKSTQGRIEKNLDDLKAKNAELQDRASALEGRSGTLTQQGPAAFLTDALAGTHVMVLRAQGTSNDALGRVRDGLKVAGAGTVSDVELKTALADPDTLAAFGAQLNLTPDQQSQPDQVQATIGQRLGELIAEVHAERTIPSPTSEPSTADTSATSDTAAPTPTTDAPAGPAATALADFLRQLDDAGLASVRGPLGQDGVSTSDMELVVLGGLTKAVDLTPVLQPALEAIAATGRPMAVAADAPLDQPLASGEESHGTVAAARGDSRLRDKVSTVDHVGDFAGVSALILALAGLPEGQVGHYGVDDGADALLPPRRP